MINWRKFAGGGMNLTVLQLVDNNNSTAKMYTGDIGVISGGRWKQRRISVSQKFGVISWTNCSSAETSIEE